MKEVEIVIVFRIPPCLYQIAIETGMVPEDSIFIYRNKHAVGPFGTSVKETGEINDVERIAQPDSIEFFFLHLVF